MHLLNIPMNLSCSKLIRSQIKSVLLIATILIYVRQLQQRIQLFFRHPSTRKNPDAAIGLQLPRNINSILSSIENGTYITSPYDKNRILPPFKRFMEKFEVSFKYGISLCIMPKTMSTLGTAIFCFLNNPTKFKAYGRKINTEKWSTSLCRKRILHDNYTRSEKFLGNTRLAFIRHPIDRFLSGFVNKCILKTANEGGDNCFGCNTSLSCFMDQLWNKLWKVYSTKKKAKRTRTTFITNHMAPQTWSCNFKEHLRDYTLIYFESGSSGAAKVAEDLYSLFRNVGIPEHLRDEVRREVSVGRSHHSTSSTIHRLRAEQELFSNRTLLRMMIELYYYDFVIFGHTLPTAS